jgi:hypothetical protein
MIYSIAGLTAHTEEIRSDGELRGYTIIVNGERIGNRIDRDASDPPLFTSIARNELPIATHETLHEAVADVVNEGMRDKARG